MAAGVVIAYKFLSAGGVGLFSRFSWPQPREGAAGEWVAIDGEVVPCLRGVHACRAEELAQWLDDELWRIELREPLLELDGMLVAPAGRLLGRVDRWDDERTEAFVSFCVARIAVAVGAALAAAGRTEDALALEAAHGDEAETLRLACEVARDESDPILFALDAARLARGGRPDLEGAAPPAAEGGPTLGARAANIAFVEAHVVAILVDPSGTGDDYRDAFAAERQTQARWLADELRLELEA